MALNVGTLIGHYDVTSLLGEGGMRQVWQATDTQLNRQVALKILPDAFADDPDRLARVSPIWPWRRRRARAYCGPNVRYQRRIVSWVTVTPR